MRDCVEVIIIIIVDEGHNCRWMDGWLLLLWMRHRPFFVLFMYLLANMLFLQSSSYFTIFVEKRIDHRVACRESALFEEVHHTGLKSSYVRVHYLSCCECLLKNIIRLPKEGLRRLCRFKSFLRCDSFRWLFLLLLRSLLGILFTGYIILQLISDGWRMGMLMIKWTTAWWTNRMQIALIGVSLIATGCGRGAFDPELIEF